MSDSLQWIVNALPLVILVGVWLFVVRKGNWQKLQSKQVELLEAQLMALRETNELLKMLAKGK